MIGLAACGGGGGSPGGTNTPTNPTGPATPGSGPVASLLLVSNRQQIPADSLSPAVIVVSALDAGSARVPNATIQLSSSGGGVLSTSSVTTGAGGTASFELTARDSDQTNRSISVTASCALCSATPVTQSIKVAGATLNASASGSTLIVGGASASVSVTVRDVRGNLMVGVPIAFASTDANVIEVESATTLTSPLGVASVGVLPRALGNASVNISGLGEAKGIAFSVSSAINALAFASPNANSVILTNTPQALRVAAQGATNVTFATTLGVFGNGLTSETVTVNGGVAQAFLTSPLSGRAIVNVADNLSRSASLQLYVSPPVESANRILLNAAKTTVPVSAEFVQSSVVVTARVLVSNGTTDQPVANAPVVFSMSGGPNGGEYLTPALVRSDSSGLATATFFGGAIASIANGVKVSASIPNTSVTTGLAPSSNDLLLTIGGQALSVAFGPGTRVQSSADNTLYLLPYSVLVTDANNNPVAGAAVTLRMRPFAFSTGPACSVRRTFCSEDVNSNGSLDGGEDGRRVLLPNEDSSISSGMCASSVVASGPGVLDGDLTPQNSDAGGVPQVLTTNSEGVASFNLTYLKQSALWIVPLLTATVASNGTESSRSTIFRLRPSTEDAGGDCFLPPSPYRE